MRKISRNNSDQRISYYFLSSIIAWTLLLGSSLIWNLDQLENQAHYLATEEARANWNKDQAFRRWATRHGGFYVKPDERTPPNPYLAHLPKRDVITTDGTKLTLMNPAYMMRQMTNEFEEMYGIKGSITGQILLNPINKADQWELHALKRFEEGELEIIDITDLKGKPYLRLMRPMIMKQGCVKCHGHLGFKVGDIRGGVSISIPLTHYYLAESDTVRAVIITHSIIWIMGMLGISLALLHEKKIERENALHDQYIKQIATGVCSASGELFYQYLVEHIASILNTDYVFIGVLNKNNPGKIVTMAFYAHGKIVPNLEYSLKHTPCANVIDQHMCVIPAGVQENFPKDKMLTEMKAEAYIGKALIDSLGNSLGLLVTLNCQPLKNTNKTAELLEIFAARAAGETERLNTEIALRRSQKMEAIGQLSSGVAHDFNNQLGIILGYLDFIKEHVKDEEKPRKWASSATNAALRCSDLTRQLLSFSGIQSKETEIVNLNIILNDLKTMFIRSVTPIIEIEFLFDKDLWLTQTNIGEFQDAILNLIINAKDSMPNGGKLIIETKNILLDESFFELAAEENIGQFIQISFSDTGCGMSKETLERIYEPFYTTKPKGQGTGLGMSMVYGFVTRYHGFIRVYSELDVGTTIRMYLPYSTSSGSTESKRDSNKIETSPHGKETILIVDDEVELVNLANDILTSLGYHTYTAQNANQALDLLDNHTNIDCLFTDIIMPGGMNGYELAKAAKLKYPNLKILMTSGFSSTLISPSEETNFSVQLLSKPYRKIELAKRIKVALKGVS